MLLIIFGNRSSRAENQPSRSALAPERRIHRLAAMADFTGALGTGTGILLAVMIVYNFYEQVSMRYMEDMHPAFRKFFE